MAKCMATPRWWKASATIGMPDSPLKGAANILVMPNMEAARISYNLLRVSSSEGVNRRAGADGGGEAGAYPDADRLRTSDR
ncbi:NADP-dependent malic enzyme [Klebsiella pneumoniae]|uniref:NADP-dependent malic enzyme n=1 Tax=Klebsiella pneumoniae TaxID=573 RepID=A0A2X1S9Q9_KLEPN|nr:NADP-dependent malic enzyme [Klebsiella pneumoniae]